MELLQEITELLKHRENIFIVVTSNETSFTTVSLRPQQALWNGANGYRYHYVFSLAIIQCKKSPTDV